MTVSGNEFDSSIPFPRRNGQPRRLDDAIGAFDRGFGAFPDLTDAILSRVTAARGLVDQRGMRRRRLLRASALALACLAVASGAFLVVTKPWAKPDRGVINDVFASVRDEARRSWTSIGEMGERLVRLGQVQTNTPSIADPLGESMTAVAVRAITPALQADMWGGYLLPSDDARSRTSVLSTSSPIHSAILLTRQVGEAIPSAFRDTRRVEPADPILQELTGSGAAEIPR